jgi:hypothetical protein
MIGELEYRINFLYFWIIYTYEKELRTFCSQFMQRLSISSTTLCPAPESPSSSTALTWLPTDTNCEDPGPGAWSFAREWSRVMSGVAWRRNATVFGSRLQMGSLPVNRSLLVPYGMPKELYRFARKITDACLMAREGTTVRLAKKKIPSVTHV